MNKATKSRNELAAKLTTMVKEDGIYRHDPATVGHKVHTAACWTKMPPYVEVDRETVVDHTTRLSFSIRVF